MPLPALLLLATAAQVGPLPPTVPEDVVVTGRRDAVDPVAELARWCLDPLRRTGRFAMPDWSPLDDATRARFGAADPAVVAVGLADPGRHRTLVLKQEMIARPGTLVERRCTLAIVGGADDAPALLAGFTRLLRAPPTQKHIGELAGTPKLPGWRQWLWAAIPQRGSSDWRGWTGSGAARAGGAWVYVVDPAGFYVDHDHVALDLKARSPGAPALCVITLSLTGDVSRR